MFYFIMIWLVGAIRVMRRWCRFSLWANEQHCEGWGLTTWNPAMTRLFWLEVRPCFGFFLPSKLEVIKGFQVYIRNYIYIERERVIWTYCWWFRNPARKSVEVGNLSHFFYKLFFNIPDGCLGFLASAISPLGFFLQLLFWVSVRRNPGANFRPTHTPPSRHKWRKH